MNNEIIYQSNTEEYFAEAKRLLGNKQIMAHILQYVVPEYQGLPIGTIAEQISRIKEHNNKWYDLICEMSIRGKKAGFVLFIEGSGKYKEERADKNDDHEDPFYNEDDPEAPVPRIIYMVALLHRADDLSAGDDRFFTLIEELPVLSSQTSEQEYIGNCFFNFAEINFNQNVKLEGVHRLLQIIFSEDNNKENLLETEFETLKKNR